MLRLRPHAVVLLTATLLAGCSTGKKEVAYVGSERTGDAGYDVEPFEGKPKVTADTYFAAGQFHETSVVSPASERLPKEQQERERRAQREVAVKQYEKALSLDPNHGPSLFRLGALKTEAKEFETALGYWRRYVDVTNGSAGAWVNLAICLECAGDFSEAETAYRNALSADPQDNTARVNLGMLLARDGRLQEATAQLSAVLSPAAVHWHLAHAMEQRGDSKAANRHFRAAASLDPTYRRTSTAAKN